MDEAELAVVSQGWQPQVKTALKRVRWQWRRMLAAARYGPAVLRGMPAVVGNAMPKSGSHLINQVLQGLPHLGPFVNPGMPPLNRSQDNRKLPVPEILANLQRMRSGDIAYGYLAAKEPYLSCLKAAGRATIFVYRDPRDMIVSHVFYATQIHTGHGMHRYYTETLQTMEERINAAIEGVDEPEADELGAQGLAGGQGSALSDIRTKYESYLGWLEHTEVLSLRFEDLILERAATLERILDYLEQRGFHHQPPRSWAVQVLSTAIEPQRSGTFRKGQPGNWREHFTPANKARFKDCTGDLLVRMGYEKDQDW